MYSSRRLSFAHCAVWAIVIGGHVLLILLLSGIRPRVSEVPDSESRSILFVDVRPRVPPRPAPQPEPERPRPTREREPIDRDSSERSTALEAPVAQPPIDWYLEADRVLQDNSAEFAEAIKPKCRPSDHPGSLRPECRAPERPAGWEPEPRKFGIDGLIPWVRVGERCVVGLGFFGCGIGKLPEADGRLFEGMHDPDRPVSSVPDVDGVRTEF